MFTNLSFGEVIEWFWEFEGGTPATSAEQNPTIMYDLEGEYDVTLTISDGTNSATLTKEDYIMVEHITNIRNNKIGEIRVYPNPTSALVYLSGSENAQVKVYNNTGSIVKEIEKLSSGSMDLSELANGIYYIQIIAEDNSVINKKIKILK